MQMAGQRQVGSNSLNGVVHRNEQENPRGLGPSGVFVLPHGILTFLSCLHHILFFFKCQYKIYSLGTALCPSPITTSSSLNIPIVKNIHTDKCSWHLAIPIFPPTLKPTDLSKI